MVGSLKKSIKFHKFFPNFTKWCRENIQIKKLLTKRGYSNICRGYPDNHNEQF